MSTYYIVIDLEMNPVDTALHACSGLYQETIEIGAVKVESGSNRIVSQFSRVIRPEYNSRIEPRITQLTGISTREVRHADTFHTVWCDFLQWIGTDPVRIYSWSNSDYLQLTQECAAKNIPFPAILADWVDFQAEYPDYLGYSNNQCLSLKKAARMIGITIVSRDAHRALYDAQITSQLVIFARSGAYRHYISSVNQEKSTMTYSLADACGGKLSALLAKMNEKEATYHADRCHYAVEAYVR